MRWGVELFAVHLGEGSARKRRGVVWETRRAGQLSLIVQQASRIARGSGATVIDDAREKINIVRIVLVPRLLPSSHRDARGI
jgi:hypothetical protein